MYIVTARHVLFSEKDNNYNLIDKAVTIKTPDFIGGENTAGIYDIMLDETNTFYHEHFDVGLIYLGSYYLTNGIKALHPSYDERVNKTMEPTERGLFYGEPSACPLADVQVGADVYIAGYPITLGSNNYHDVFDMDRPVLRKGIISHVNYKRKHIIIDCMVFSGNSGGPVFEVDKDGDSQKKLIGLVSKYIPYRQRYVIPNESIEHINYVNSGYALVVSMDHVIESIIVFAQKLPDPYAGRTNGDWNDIFSDRS